MVTVVTSRLSDDPSSTPLSPHPETEAKDPGLGEKSASGIDLTPTPILRVDLSWITAISLDISSS